MKQIILFILFIGLISSGCKKYDDLGTSDSPIIVYFMPAKNPKDIKKLAQITESLLSQKTGLSVKAFPAKNTMEIIDKFEKGKAHIAFINTFGYLLARYWGDADARLCLIFRSGNSFYQGQIVVNTKSGIQRPTDLLGRTIAFKGPFSTAGFILPVKYFKVHHITPKKTMFLYSYRNILLAVYKGKADAGAVYYDSPGKTGKVNDARKLIAKEYPDVYKKLKLLVSTGKIKSSPIVFRRDLPEDIQAKLSLAFLSLSKNKKWAEALSGAYDAIGLEEASDSDYNDARQLLKILGKDAEHFVPGGYKLILRKRLPVIGNYDYP